MQNRKEIIDRKTKRHPQAELPSEPDNWLTSGSQMGRLMREMDWALTLLLGPLEDVLDNHDVLSSKNREQLKGVHRNGLRLLKLVNTLRDFSRLEAGRVRAVYEPTELAAFTAELANAFRPAIEKAGLRLIVDCPPLPEPIYVGREMWEKIVLHLLSNAFKFTLAGEIRVRLRIEEEGGKGRKGEGGKGRRGDAVQTTDNGQRTTDNPDNPKSKIQNPKSVILTVRDTGTGIPADELPHIFERFYRVRNAPARTPEGMGIGLALVREFARLQGGKVTVESRLQEGATFTVTIPTGKAHLPADRVREESTTAHTMRADAFVAEALRWLPEEDRETGRQGDRETGRQGDRETRKGRENLPFSPSRILLADSNAARREDVRRLLSQQYEVEAVADGPTALAAARTQLPDLVLTDVMTPEPDGFELLRALRDDEQLRDVPVILLSSRASEEARIEGLAAGADDYLIKPFSERELLARVVSNLKLAELRRASQAALRASEAKFSIAFDRSPLALTITAIDDGRLVEVNEGFERLSGYTREEAVGRTPEELGLWVEPKQRAERFARMQAGERVPNIEARFRVKGGGERIGVIGSALVEIDARLCVLSSVMDITERKRVEEEWRASEERLRRVIEAAPNALLMVDQEGHIALVNSQAEQLFGYSRKQLLGAPVEKLVPERFRHRHTDFRAGFYAAPQARKMGAGRDLFCLRKDGAEVPVEIGLSPMKTDAGEFVLISLIDISERKQAEAKLRESEERFRQAADAAEAFIYEVDLLTGSAAIIYGMERVVGYNAREVTPNSGWWHALIHPEDLPAHLAQLEQNLKQGGTDLTEYRVRHQDGSWINVQDSRLVLHDGQGKAIRLVGAVTNITARKREELNQQFLLKLGDLIRKTDDAEELLATASAMLGQHLDVARCFFNEIDLARGTAKIHFDYRRSAALPSFIGTVHLADYSPVTQAAIEAGHTVVVTDTRTDARTASQYETVYAVDGIGAYIAVPLLREGRWTATLWVNTEPPRVWTDAEIALLETVSERLWLAAEKLRSEAALRESQAMLSLSMRSSRMGAWSRDIETNAVWWSAELEEIFGLEKGGFVGTESSFYELVHEDDRPKIAAEVEKALAEHRDYTIEFRFYHADGSLRWMEGRGHAVYSDQRAPIRLYGIGIDITERKQAEEKLRESEERLRLATEAAQMYSWEIDLTTRKIKYSANAPHVLGYELLPENFEAALPFIHAEDRGRLVRETRRAINETGMLVLEYRALKPTQEILWLEAHAVVIRDEKGKPMRLIGIGQNISERKRIERERENLLEREQQARELAEETNRAKDEFLAVVTHELRSPLNAMLGYARIYSDRRATLPPEMAEVIDIIKRNGERQKILIDDLLDTARIITGKLRLDVRPFDVAAVIREAIATVQPAAEAKQINLIPLSDGAAAQLTGDPDRVQQVVWNLLTNAVKFTPEGGTIKVELQREDTRVAIIVTDTGIGITPDFLPHVFERFTQQDASRSRRHGGLGLGLALVKQLVELHGGTIEAASAGADTGATFIVRLPLRTVYTPPQEPAVTERSSLLSQESSTALAEVRVLVVEDEAEARELVQSLLSNHGALVTAVSSAAVAFALLTDEQRAERFHLLLCDIGMPEEDGYGLLRRFRQWERERQQSLLPAIALTAHSGATDRLQSLLAGFQMYVAKPIEPDELIVVTKSLIDRKRRIEGTSV